MRNKITINDQWLPWMGYFADTALLSAHTYHTFPELNDDDNETIDEERLNKALKMDSVLGLYGYRVVEKPTKNNSGFSTTLYEKDGKYTLAIRGTEAHDWNEKINDVIIADILGLGTNSLPTSQVADMVEYIDTLIDKGYTNMSITGHSLGGSLAQIAAKMYPYLFDCCYVFNAPSGKDLKSPDVHINNEATSPDEYYFERVYDYNEIGYYDKPLPYKIGQAYYNYQHTDMTTQVFNISGSILPKNIANLYNKERFGYDIEVVGIDHSIDTMAKTIAFYDFIGNCEYVNHSLSNATSHINLFDLIDDPFNKKIDDIVNQMEKHLSLSEYDYDTLKILIDYKNNGYNFEKKLMYHQPLSNFVKDIENITYSEKYTIMNDRPIMLDYSSLIDDDLKREYDEYSKNYLFNKMNALSIEEHYKIRKPLNVNINDLANSKTFEMDKVNSFESAQADTVFGTLDSDTYEARENFKSTIFALSGDDYIKGSNKHNYIEAGSGNDTIDVKNGEDGAIIYGDISDKDDITLGGDDIIYAGKSGGHFYGGYGFDKYYIDGGYCSVYDADGKGEIYFKDKLFKGGGKLNLQQGLYEIWGNNPEKPDMQYNVDYEQKTIHIYDLNSDLSAHINFVGLNNLPLGIELGA